MKKIIIIGAGIGGLSTGILLAQHGFSVTILEKNRAVGGRLSGFSTNGFSFDTGPTLLLMPEVLHEFFRKTGHATEEFVELVALDPVYTVHFGKNQHMQISSNNAKTLEAIRDISKKDAEKFFAYLQKGEEYFTLAKRFFLQKNVHRPQDFLNARALQALLRIGFSKKYYGHVSDFFEDEKIRAAFSFQSIYVGASPLDIPAAYSLIQFVEITQGVWTVRGGLHRIANALEKIALEKKVDIQTNTTVKKIMVENKRAIGVELSNGKKLEADLVISNADLPFTYQHLLGQKTSPMQQKKLENSCSAFMLYLGVNKKLPGLLHHQFLLPKNFLKAMHELFHEKKLPKDPGIYLNCASRLFPELAPENGETLYVLVPVPNLENGINWKKEKNRFKKKVLEKINRILKLDLKQNNFLAEKIITPLDWQKQFSLHQGSTFGLAPTLFQSAFFRPQNRDPAIKNLYFVGASTHPGSGIPIVLFSAQNVVARIIEEQAKM